MTQHCLQARLTLNLFRLLLAFCGPATLTLQLPKFAHFMGQTRGDQEAESTPSENFLCLSPLACLLPGPWENCRQIVWRGNYQKTVLTFGGGGAVCKKDFGFHFTLRSWQFLGELPFRLSFLALIVGIDAAAIMQCLLQPPHTRGLSIANVTFMLPSVWCVIITGSLPSLLRRQMRLAWKGEEKCTFSNLTRALISGVVLEWTQVLHHEQRGLLGALPAFLTCGRFLGAWHQIQRQGEVAELGARDRQCSYETGTIMCSKRDREERADGWKSCSFGLVSLYITSDELLWHYDFIFITCQVGIINSAWPTSVTLNPQLLIKPLLYSRC